MKNFIIMQNTTYELEKEAGIIWCPVYDRAGNVPHSWLRIREIEPDNILFHYSNGDIVAVSRALGGAQLQNKPEFLDTTYEGLKEGYVVNLYYHELERPISIRKFFNEIVENLPIKYSPFQLNGRANQGYVYPCNEELTLQLLKSIRLEFDNHRLHNEPFSLPAIIQNTEAEAVQKIRIGQQKFKNALLELWHHKCAICNIKIEELLRASHSKPWKDCNDNERLDPYNGLLLCCNHDALYDKGFITFNINGEVKISERLKIGDYSDYAIHLNLKIPVDARHLVYLNWHQSNIFKQNPVRI
ncbi:MAG: HNH endonuclease [Psychrobacillus psychrodurans]